jgi:hypothetical protein
MKESCTQLLNFVMHRPSIMFCTFCTVNEEINVVEPVPKEEPSSLEVGFDICGTDPEPEIPVNQGKSGCI